MDGLLRSHAELCAALRLVGRQMLRFESQGAQSLERIRKVLKRAENIRKALKSPEEFHKLLKEDGKIESALAQLGVLDEALAPPAPENNGASGGKVPETPSKPAHRLTRPHAHRVLRFPTGERWA